LEELKGKQLIAVVNIGTRMVADFESQCLVLGANEKDTIILLAPETKLPNGQQIL
jgi:tRNA-binding protein